MIRVSCDTNILVPVFGSEAQSARIEAWIESPGIDPAVSELVVLELSATISRLVTERVLDDVRARTISGEFDAWCKARARPLTITGRIFALARTIVEDAALGVRGPDALHLALLQITGLPFATFDLRLRSAAAALGRTAVAPPPL
ncbi:MAG: type II toxin-antitoxin system VapC family toxin [Methylobacterium sp.]|uniref:type II toxin-antitoxin system VapC family toxin n=1 Tax=Methylobacterium sp. TaxID=409 RepID=UPI0025907C99|nr:type II toxin-antitoxin system VapC family toxin [Methylobacterium sp.]MBY0298097.1 type II toxin-antitoxin system VapC family toxin [Methylobacterium sp.]